VDKIVGGLLIASFIIYISLVLWSIYRGVLAAPQDSDSDSDTDSEDDGGEYSEEIGTATNADISLSPAQTSLRLLCLLPTSHDVQYSIIS
jgi:hypothetical protein